MRVYGFISFFFMKIGVDFNIIHSHLKSMKDTALPLSLKEGIWQLSSDGNASPKHCLGHLQILVPGIFFAVLSTDHIQVAVILSFLSLMRVFSIVEVDSLLSWLQEYAVPAIAAEKMEKGLNVGGSRCHDWEKKVASWIIPWH